MTGAAPDHPEHVIVVGGGIVGVTTAYFLARRGARVTLLDAGAIGAGASFGNAGIVALGHPPINRPGLIRQGLRMMLDASSPLHVPPRLSLSLAAWLWGVRRWCTRAHLDHSMRVLGDLARVTEASFEEILAAERLTCEYHRAGWLDVYRTTTGLGHGRADAALIARAGYESRELSGDELREREPVFRREVVGAIHYPQSSFADPHELLVQVAERASLHGATIRTHAPVETIEIERGAFAAIRTADGERHEADALVLAAGSWTTELARQVGVRLPMEPGKGYHVNLVSPAGTPFPRPSVASVLAEAFVAATPMGEALRLAGTIEFSGMNDRLVEKRVAMLAAGARQYLEGVDAAHEASRWCGLRPCTIDGLPVIGRAPGVRGVLIATGHAKMGFALGPGTGRLVSECLLDGRPSLDLAPLAVDRFRRPRAVRGRAARPLQAAGAS